MSWRSASSLPPRWLLYYCLMLFLRVVTSGSSYFCSRNMYDSPVMQDCSHALATLPPADEFYRYYIEQQLKTAPPESDWQGWRDERPTIYRRKVIQVPKFWSHGKQACLRTDNTNSIRGKLTCWRWYSGSCNLALLSYVDGNSKTGLSFSRWANVYLAGYTLVQTCLNLHSQGGAATINGRFWAQPLLFFQALSRLSYMTQMPLATLRWPCSSGKMGPSSTARWTSTRVHHFPQALILGLQQSWRRSVLSITAWTPSIAHYQKVLISFTQRHWYIQTFWTAVQARLTAQPSTRY